MEEMSEQELKCRRHRAGLTRTGCGVLGHSDKEEHSGKELDHREPGLDTSGRKT